MSSESIKKTFEEIFALADIKVNGSRPHDLQVHNPKFYARVLSGGSLAFGESYMDGWWDCKDLTQLFTNIFQANLDKKVKGLKYAVWNVLKAKVLNLQSKNRSRVVGKKHYDVGNDLHKVMLDKRLVYSCGYWDKASTLDKAQEAKLELCCKKLKLKPGMKVLDIGCGWGSFAKFAAEKYKVSVVGITISKEQAELGQELCKGLPVEIRLQDYRDVEEKFDRIISIGMFEHVGVKNYREYMKVVRRCLKEDGLSLLHTIGRDTSTSFSDPWSCKYIFPNSMLPSAKQIATAAEGLFTLEDWHNFGSPSYEKTLIEWQKNFIKHWPKLQNKDKYNERFYRMWIYYLCSAAGGYRSRSLQLWQVVFSPKESSKPYTSVR